jgi:hypothetical protein
VSLCDGVRLARVLESNRESGAPTRLRTTSQKLLPLSPHIGQGHVVGGSSFADIRQHRLLSNKTVLARMGEEGKHMLSNKTDDLPRANVPVSRYFLG